MNRAKDSVVKPRRRSLYRQFISSLFIPFVLVFLLAGAGTVLIGYHAQRVKLESERTELMSVYARSLVKPLWDCDTATLNGIVNALAYQQGVADVQLLDACSGQTIAAGSNAGQPDLTPPYRQLIHHKDSGGRSFQVGELVARFSRISIWTAAVDLLWRYLVLFIAMFTVLLVGTLLVFRRVVDQPLARFRNAINMEIESRDTIQRLRNLPTERQNDELGDVMAAYGGLMMELDSRYKRQQTLAQCASELLATSSQDASPLIDVLERVRITMDADRLYLAENDINEAGEFYLNYTVLAGRPFGPGSSPADFEEPPEETHWAGQFKERQPVTGTIAQFPMSDQQVLRRRGVRSLAAFPVWGHSHWYGFICVEDLEEDRDWSASEKTFLQTVADMIGAFLENANRQQQLATVIDRLRENEKTLMRIARRDPLTDLGNRIVLDEELERAVLRAKRLSLHGYVLLIDLNHFKPINDTYGHSVGDQVLRITAQRLLDCVRRTDTVVRLGGDEFVIIVEGSRERPNLTALTAKLTASLSRLQYHDGHTMAVGACIGAACFPDDGTSSDTLLAQADKDMYLKKTLSGQGRQA